mmetsp:Transcript_29491/g.51786  ORF Transcript_29491/g.51786 Transcript_29491/m.51786 type:complete len:512 (+) Transcript_29491:612-2147(+)
MVSLGVTRRRQLGRRWLGAGYRHDDRPLGRTAASVPRSGGGGVEFVLLVDFLSLHILDRHGPLLRPSALRDVESHALLPVSVALLSARGSGGCPRRTAVSDQRQRRQRLLALRGDRGAGSGSGRFFRESGELGIDSCPDSLCHPVVPKMPRDAFLLALLEHLVGVEALVAQPCGGQQPVLLEAPQYRRDGQREELALLLEVWIDLSGVSSHRFRFFFLFFLGEPGLLRLFLFLLEAAFLPVFELLSFLLQLLPFELHLPFFLGRLLFGLPLSLHHLGQLPLLLSLQFHGLSLELPLLIKITRLHKLLLPFIVHILQGTTLPKQNDLNLTVFNPLDPLLPNLELDGRERRNPRHHIVESGDGAHRPDRVDNIARVLHQSEVVDREQGIVRYAQCLKRRQRGLDVLLRERRALRGLRIRLVVHFFVQLLAELTERHSVGQAVEEVFSHLLEYRLSEPLGRLLRDFADYFVGAQPRHLVGRQGVLGVVLGLDSLFDFRDESRPLRSEAEVPLHE